MHENAILNGFMGRIELGFVKREVTLRLLTKLSIQLHPAGLSLANSFCTRDIQC